MNPFTTIDHENWRQFFTSFRTLLKPSKLEYQLPSILPANFLPFAQSFSQLHDENRRLGNEINIWKIAQVGDDELKNSSILAWLLNCNGSHGQGDLFLVSFLKLLKRNGNFVFPNISIDKPYWTKVESLPFGDQESRIDIEIEGEQFLLFIEVKINAPETNDQLERYINIAKNKAANRPWVVVFLTPNGRRPSDESLHEIVISVGWYQIQKIIWDHACSLPKELLAPTIFKQLANHFAIL